MGQRRGCGCAELTWLPYKGGALRRSSRRMPAVDGWTPLWLSCYTSMAPGTFYDQGAFLLAVKPNQDGGLLTNLKGRF